MKTKTKLRFQDLPKSYEALCRVFLPRPIHDAVDYANVVEVTDAMVLWHDEFTRDQADYFDLLCSLIEDYDSENVKWPKVTGVEMLNICSANKVLRPQTSRVFWAAAATWER